MQLSVLYPCPLLKQQYLDIFIQENSCMVLGGLIPAFIKSLFTHSWYILLGEVFRGVYLSYRLYVPLSLSSLCLHGSFLDGRLKRISMDEVRLLKRVLSFSSNVIYSLAKFNIYWVVITFFFPGLVQKWWSRRKPFSKIQHWVYSLFPLNSTTTWVNWPMYDRTLSFSPCMIHLSAAIVTCCLLCTVKCMVSWSHKKFHDSVHL